ncbi:MAG: hypothetical protein JKY95_09520 [Planctomycetaceae bacterium]|nr:hypothetical protein [Planctomycetaceae bacterium]
MNVSWTDSVRFFLTAILAAILFGIVILAPLTVRNSRFKQLCYDQQLELIELEAENKTRKLFAQRIELSPELKEQIRQTESDAGQNQTISLPEDLVIHPDQMLLVASDESPEKRTISKSKSWHWEVAESIQASSAIQNRLLSIAVLLLLIGSIPSSWFHWRFFQRQLSSTTGNIIARYRNHCAHEEIPPPHWDHSSSTRKPANNPHEIESG